MVINKLLSSNQLYELIKMFDSDCLYSNCYSIKKIENYIKLSKVEYANTNSNLFLFVKKAGFYQIFYYIKNMEERIDLALDLPSIMEILFRGDKKPIEIIKYWGECGFKEHMYRDNMVAVYSNIILPDNLNNGIVVRFANNETDAVYVCDKISETFDRFTGDLKTLDEIREDVNNHQVLIAEKDGQFCGFLRIEMYGSVCGIGHIAVDSAFRRQGIADCLVTFFIERNKQNEKARYQLWVLKDNIPALNLYRKFGFIYGNKSTMSMLKI